MANLPRIFLSLPIPFTCEGAASLCPFSPVKRTGIERDRKKKPPLTERLSAALLSEVSLFLLSLFFK